MTNDEHEKIAARLTLQMSTRHRIDDELYREAEHAFGTTGLFDIAILMSQYHTVCTLLRLFEVPAPSETTYGGVGGNIQGLNANG
jgi:4-carboxymuconolactone decarboxylase